MTFLDDFGADPTVAIPRETASELMRRDCRVEHAPIPMRPASLTETREMPIPEELIALTA